MKRDFLKELGFEDDVIDKIMVEHGKTVNDYKTKAEKADGLEAQVADYETQIKDRDQQLEDLGNKAKGHDELTKEIDDLKQANKDAKADYDQKLHQISFDNTLEKSLAASKVKNPATVKALLNLDDIKLDGEKLLGLDDQLKSIKESDSYLFESDQSPKNPTIVNPGNPGGGSNTTKTVDKMSYQELADLKANDPDAFQALTNN